MKGSKSFKEILKSYFDFELDVKEPYLSAAYLSEMGLRDELTSCIPKNGDLST